MGDHKRAGLGINEVLGDKRQAVLALTSSYGITNVRVFGSVARGEARPDSDVDLLVDAPVSLGLKLMRAGRELEALLGRPVDLIPEDSLRQRLRPRVLREAVPL